MTDKDQTTGDDTPVKADDPIALWLLDALADGAEMKLEDAARGVAETKRKKKDPPDLWRRYLTAVRQQAIYLARQGRLEIVRSGKAVDPNDFKGLVKLRLPQ